MRVATFNVHHCEGLDGRVDVPRIAGIMGECAAELIALQELDRHLPRSGSVDQPAALAEASGMSVAFHPTLTRTRGDYGIGIATRSPVDTIFERLPMAGDEEPRGALICEYRGISVIVTHLSRDRSARSAQVERVASMAAAAPPPVLVLGDMNTEARGLALMTAAGLVLCGGAPTMPARRPRRQIDHVLAGQGLQIERCWSIATDASDHRPLVADVAIMHIEDRRPGGVRH
jgi:endonuclease/exonuclease/phosphatase family metal-dependent hydrolase